MKGELYVTVQVLQNCSMFDIARTHCRVYEIESSEAKRGVSNMYKIVVSMGKYNFYVVNPMVE